MNSLFYAVMYVCLNGVCDPQVVSEAKPLKECIVTMVEKREEFKKLDKDVIASCVPNTDYE